MPHPLLSFFWKGDPSDDHSRQHRDLKSKSHLAGVLPTPFLKSDFQKFHCP
jgi:hypothetical protein